MKNERVVKKAGCVLMSGDKVALVYRAKLNDYSFPKGHLEEGENLIECALRETEEETGRVAKLLREEPIHVTKYNNHEGQCWVYMYLAKDLGVSKKEFDLQDREEVVWVNVKEVEEKLTYQVLKDMWNEVKDEAKLVASEHICSMKREK